MYVLAEASGSDPGALELQKVVSHPTLVLRTKPRPYGKAVHTPAF